MSITFFVWKSQLVGQHDMHVHLCSSGHITGGSVVIWKIMISNAKYTVHNACIYSMANRSLHRHAPNWIPTPLALQDLL